MKSGPQQLKDWMIRRKFLQRETADHLGFHETFISQLLNGARVPGLENAIHIERETGIPVEAWLPSDRGQTEQPVTAGSGKPRQDKA